jgi:hypothetical protein
MNNQHEPMGFESQLHEELFALFIIEANNLFSRQFKPAKREELIYKCMLVYFNCWEDRSLADVEYEGWINAKNNDCKLLESSPTRVAETKIVYRFVEEL